MKMIWPQVGFCSGNICITLSFQIKKKSNSQNFAHMGFCAPEMLTKFWGLTAGMDFDIQ